MDFSYAVNHFYYRLSLRELQYMNNDDYYKGLSYNNMLYLDVIYSTKDCTVSKLAEMLGVTKSAVTIRVNELIKQDYVKRKRSEKDKRVYYLTLNRSMEEIYEQYFSIFDTIGKKMRNKYTDKEINKFCEMLEDISEYRWEGAHDE